MSAIRQIYSNSNAAAAKIWGAGTVIIALLLAPQWGAIPAAVLIVAGALPWYFSHIGPSSIIRWVALHISYWFLILLGVGLGVTGS